MKHETHQSRAGRADPQRTCIGCRRQTSQRDMFRLVRSPDGEVIVDHPHRLGGRGAYVCSSLSCFKRAVRPSLLERTLGGAISAPALPAFIGAVQDRVCQRIDGLLASAGRARKVAIGASETDDALNRRSAELVMLASDVSPRVRSHVEIAAERADVVVSEFGDKWRLGDAFARSEVGAIALTDPGFATTVLHELKMLGGLSTTQEGNETSSTRHEALERAT